MKKLLVLSAALLAFAPATVSAEPPARLVMSDFMGGSDTLDDGDASDTLDAAVVDALVSSRDGQRLALSTLLCEARQYREDVQDRLILQSDAALKAEATRTDARIARTKAKLNSLGLEPLECDAVAVTRLVECRTLVAPAECTADEDLAAQVRAVAQVATMVDGVRS